MKKILVSACLYGHCTRYDAKSNIFKDELFLEWKNRGMLIPVCPEELGGLKTPRLPAEIQGDKVINSDGEDVTENFRKGAEETLKIAKDNNVRFAILKEGSPSCGCKTVYDGTFSGKKVSGSGVCAKMLLQNGIVVLSEEDMFVANVLLNENGEH